MKTSTGVLALSGALLIASICGGAEPDSSKDTTTHPIQLQTKTKGLDAEVVSLSHSKHVPLYMPAGSGSAKTGTIVQGRSLLPAQDMSRIIMVKDSAGDAHTFIAGSTDSPEDADFVAIVLTVQVRNATDRPQVFTVSICHSGQLKIRTSSLGQSASASTCSPSFR